MTPRRLKQIKDMVRGYPISGLDCLITELVNEIDLLHQEIEDCGDVGQHGDIS